MECNKKGMPLWIYYWAALVGVSLLTRSYVPIDETRYVSVAWEMWLRGDFLVPHLNGEIYSQKPPLLFWMFNLGWALFGVNDLWPRLVSPLFGLASLFLTMRIARRLWPDRPHTASAAPLILVCSMLWSIFLSAVMFDMLVVFFTLLGVLGIVHSWKKGGITGWMILGAAVGLGILSKGPVILVHTLPLALLAPWWAVEHQPGSWARWYSGVALSILIGIVIGLAWAVPAALSGGEQYAQAIFWKQSAGRVAKSFAHERPFWWYVPLLPALLFPWALWPALWRAFCGLRSDPPSSPVRICFAWLVSGLAIFSLISGKQPHYLLPLFPAFALISSYALDRGVVHLSWDPIFPGIALATLGAGLLALMYFSGDPMLIKGFARAGPYCGYALITAGILMPVSCALLRMRPILPVSAAALALVLMLDVSLIRVMAAYDVRGLSAYVGSMQRAGVAVSYVGTYHGMFNFLGRLDDPVESIREEEVAQWARSHPEGLVIADEEHLQPREGMVPVYEYDYGVHHTIRVWKGRTIVAAQGR